METFGLGSRSLAAWVMAGTGPSSCVSLRLLWEGFPVLCAPAVRTCNLVHYFRCPWQWQFLFRASECCWGVWKVGFFGICLFPWVQHLVRQWIHVLRQASDVFHTLSTLWRTRITERSFSIRFEWRSVPIQHFWLPLGDTGRPFTSFTWLSCVTTDRVFRCSVRHFSASSSESRPQSANEYQWLVDKKILAEDRVQNNNNNTIWKGSVFTGEEPPPHSGKLNHALPQAGGPTQSQVSRPVSSRHHISMEHRLRRKHLLLNPFTNARKEKERKTIKKKKKKKKKERKRRKKRREKKRWKKGKRQGVAEKLNF